MLGLRVRCEARVTVQSGYTHDWVRVRVRQVTPMTGLGLGLVRLHP